MRTPTSLPLALAGTTLLSLFSTLTSALNPIQVKGQDFVDSATGDRFEIIGVDYQPGGEAAYNPNSGADPLSNGEACLRDAILMQNLGLNTIRVYNVDPYINHDECASIFNAAGMYMIIDVNSPLPGQSINQADPAPSYNIAYLNRTFAVVDAFRNFPNTLGFFSANELVNDETTSLVDPPYIRAVQRDLKQYISARGGRIIPVGYSAADVRPELPDITNYLTCHMPDDSNDDTRIDFFGLNSYSWCGNATFVSSTYNQLASDYARSTTPVFFSEFGCNKVLPRQFTEIDALYGPMMTTWSGGLVYQWTEETNNFGLVNINSDNSVTILGDYNTLKTRYDSIDLKLIRASNDTANNLKPPTCSAGLIDTQPFDTKFDIPAQPKGVASLISAGGAGKTGTIKSLSATTMPVRVTAVGGGIIQNLALSTVSSANLPGSSSFSGVGGMSTSAVASGASGSSSSSSSHHNAAPAMPTGIIGGTAKSAAVAVVVVDVLVRMLG